LAENSTGHDEVVASEPLPGQLVDAATEPVLAHVIIPPALQRALHRLLRRVCSIDLGKALLMEKSAEQTGAFAEVKDLSVARCIKKAEIKFVICSRLRLMDHLGNHVRIDVPDPEAELVIC